MTEAVLVGEDNTPDGPHLDRTEFQGLPITIEYYKDEFKPDDDSYLPNCGFKMYADYGYINEIMAGDGEELDCYIGEDRESTRVFIAMLYGTDDNYPEGPAVQCLDEPKILLGFTDEDDAEEFLAAQYGQSRIASFSESSLTDLYQDVSLLKQKFELEMSHKAEINTDGTTSAIMIDEIPEPQLVVEMDLGKAWSEEARAAAAEARKGSGVLTAQGRTMIKRTITSVQALKNPGSAVKLRNHLIKEYNAAPYKDFSQSNPYSSVQTVRASMPDRDAERLKGDLVHMGWQERSGHLMPGNVNYDHPTEKNTSIMFSKYSEGGHDVKIYGPKKAKANLRPYYD